VKQARAALVAAMVAAGLWGAGLSAAQERLRTVNITAVDKAGAPVLDLRPADLEVKERGKRRAVRAVEPATGLMHIALIVDDNGTGLFRSSVAQFITRLQREAEFAISVVMGQSLRLVDYTSDFDKLTGAVGYLGARPATPDGGQLLGAIYETARDMQKRELQRPVIIVMTVGGEEHNPMPAHQVLDQLRDSHASLNVFEMTSSVLRPMQPVSRASGLLEESLNINEVIGDGSKQTGGRRDEMVAVTGLVKGMLTLADELSHQYRLTYVLPAGVDPSDRLEVSTTRRDVEVRAPTRVSTK
jgi:VWFA-related protein